MATAQRRAAYVLLGAFELAPFSALYECVFRVCDAAAGGGGKSRGGGGLAISLAVGILNGLYVCLLFDLVFPAAAAARADGREGEEELVNGGERSEVIGFF